MCGTAKITVAEVEKMYTTVDRRRLCEKDRDESCDFKGY